MKKVKNNLTVLERELNEMYEKYGYIIPSFVYPYLRRAQIAFAVKAIQEERQRKRKEMIKVLRLLPKWFFVGYFYFLKARLKKWFFNMAVKQARIEADIQNRKIWIVQSTDLTYTLISTKNFRDGKKVKVFKKELDYRDMDEAAERTIYPTNQKR